MFHDKAAAAVDPLRRTWLLGAGLLLAPSLRGAVAQPSRRPPCSFPTSPHSSSNTR